MKKIIDLIRVDLISAKGRNKGIFFLIFLLTAAFVVIELSQKPYSWYSA